jgi:DNA-binding transcriptional LysR family regulator
MNLALYSAPIEIPEPDIFLFWHRRHDHDPAHKWLREQISAEVQAFQV